MAVTFKTYLGKPRKDGFFKVYIRVTNFKKHSYIDTGMKIYKTKVENGVIKDHHVNGRCSRLISEYTNKLNLVDYENWDVKEIETLLTSGKERISFTDYCQTYIDNLFNDDRNNTAIGYDTAVKSFKKFFGENVDFVDITTKKINDWIHSLRNTARAKENYPKAIKAIFDAGCLEYNDNTGVMIRIPNKPFDGVKIPKHDLPEQRAVEVDVIRKIINYEAYSKRTEMAVDVAKIIICLAGINTMDLFHLTQDNIKNGKLDYNRRKTMGKRQDNARMVITIRPEIKDLMKKYNNGNRLFDFGYKTAKDFNKYVNIGLKKVCEIVGVEELGTYAFRHSFATIAENDCGVPKERVALSLNHVSAHKITDIYVKRDFSKVDEVIETVVNYIFRGDINAGISNNPDLVGNLVEAMCQINNKTLGELNDISVELFKRFRDGFNVKKIYEIVQLPDIKLSGNTFKAYLYLSCKLSNPVILQKLGFDYDAEYKMAYETLQREKLREIA